ncbi:exopolysaccharide biosynthesis polyprenyl glycosylphosphotransferase [Vulcanococcus limneticus]|jgi:exopolysaccharide biosynthesis polyprenyl glycosylphosphotransferase|uniref:exopolysaccharide biosynthesis polyprenyl glycosylphosphotransferase n=1 Tax=Vulcanococcus limneticus TaxID=2170428 RepID=UPI00350559A5
MLLALALADTGLLIVFYNLFFWRRFHQWVGITPSVAILILLWVGSSYLLGRYSSPEQGQQDSKRKRLVTTAIVPLLVLTCVVVVVSWGLKVEDPRTFRSFLLPLLGTVFAGSALGQIWITNWRRTGQRWLLVGDGEELDILRRELGSESHTHQLLFCDGDDLGALNLPETDNVDAIAVSESARLDDALLQDLLARRGSGSSICSLVVWAEQHLQRVPPELFSSRWLVQAEGFELQPGRWGWRLKRLGDLVVASGLLLLTAPLLLAAAALIRLEDGGPIFYGQQRTGLYGERILIWKLRSMRQNAERSGARWASRNDARITTVGNWLRRLRIDELPQLVSVLSGDMSLIGPRPERPELELDLEEKIPHYRVRHWVRPGLSGWAQVCYPYGASIEDSRMKLSYDLYYLRNANLMLDFLILIKTLRLVARGQGAVPQQLSPG